MLDPKCKSMRLMITYLGREAVATLVADYDKQLLLLLLEVYKGLLPNRRDYLDEFASFVDSHDLFVETNKTINTYKDIVCYKLSSFHYYFVDAKTFYMVADRKAKVSNSACSCKTNFWNPS